MPPKRTLATVVLALVACGPGLVQYPERSETWLGSRKRTLKAAEEALRAAMAAPGLKLVPSPGNDEPVMITPTCVNGGWFTLDGSAAQWLGEGYQYAWHVCVTDEGKYQLAVSCLEVKKTETSTDSHECPGGQVAGTIAKRTDDIAAQLKGK